MKTRKPSLTIRMGAAHWDVTAHGTGDRPVAIDLRTLSKEEQRKVVFTVVKTCRDNGLVVT